MADPQVDLLRAVQTMAEHYRQACPPTRATIVIPAWMQAKIDALPDHEQAELIAHVEQYAAAYGFSGVDVEVAASAR